MTLGARLAQIRKDQSPKMSQEEFARSLGIARSAYAMYEINRVIPSDSVLKLISMTYGVDPRWLETGEGEPYIKADIDIAKEIRAIMRGESEYSIAVITSLASMPPEWWEAWREAFDREIKK